MLKKRTVLCILAVFLFFLTSCWDLKEIEKQAYIMGLALDTSDNGEYIEVTFQIAQPSAFAAEGNPEEPFWNVTELALDITGAQKQLSKSMNLIPTLEHCQVILVGEEFAQEKLQENLDFILRTHDVRRMIHIGVAEGKAKDIFHAEFRASLLPAMALSEMMADGNIHSLEMTDYMNVGRIHIADTSGYDFVLTRLRLPNGKLDMTGGAVMKDMELVGWLNGEELMGIRFLRGDVGSGFLSLQLPEEIGKRAMMQVFESQSALEPEIRDGRLHAKLELRIEGDITEIIRKSEIINEMEYLRKLERLYEQDIKAKIKKAFQKVQKEFNSDPFLLKEKVKYYYPKFWKANQENWDEIYQSTVLEIEARVLIRRIGEISH